MENQSKEYIAAKKQVIEIFNEPTPFRKILFWFDPAKTFQTEIENDTDFKDITVLFYKNNPFTIKEKVEYGEYADFNDASLKILIYYPYEKPKDEANWLEDMLLYSKSYYADRVGLTMQTLGLEGNDFRAIISEHIKFFDSKDRVNSLKSKINENKNISTEFFVLAIMSVIVKSKYFDIQNICAELLFDQSGDKYSDLKKFNFEKTFWDMISDYFSYSGSQSIKDLESCLLLTSFSQEVDFKIDDVPQLSSKIQKSETENILIFVDKILSTDTRYKDFETEFWNDYRIKDLLSTKGLDTLKRCDVFYEIDDYISLSIIKSLTEGNYDYSYFLNIIKNNRINSKYYKEFETRYDFIVNVIKFKQNISLEIPLNKSADDYIELYKKSFYMIDSAYRHIINLSDKLNSDDALSDIIIKLIKEVDNEYEKFLEVLGSSFSNSLKDIEPKFNFATQNMSIEFYNKFLNYRDKKQFVIISDAMRYEVGNELMEKLNSMPEFSGNAEIKGQITTLPSITMFGMASLLPRIGDISYKKKEVLVDNKPTNGITARNKILSSRDTSYCAIQYSLISKMNKSDLRDFMKDKSLVYIYHDTIDNAGEHDNNVFEACNIAIEEIIKLIKKLYQSLQISTYFVTSDHGFIYRHKEITSESKYPSFGAIKPDDLSQRYAILDETNQVEFNNVNEFDMDYLGDSNSKLRVITPYGYNFFVKQGGGIQYIHGGASLQELITPIVCLTKMRSNADSSKASPVKVILKTQNRKITTKSFSLTFEQVEKVGMKKIPNKLSLYFIDEDNNIITDKITLICNKDTDNLDDRDYDVRFRLLNIQYNRNKKYYLVMENADTQTLVNANIRFIIEIANFKSII